MYNSMNGAVRDAFHPGELTTGQTRHLVGHTSRVDNRQAFADSLSAETIWCLAELEDLSVDALGSIWHFSSWDPAQRFALQLYTGPIGRPWRNMDASTYANTMGRIADAARLPYYQAESSLAEIGRDIEDLPVTRWVSRTMLPAIPYALEGQARHEATLDLMQLGLLLELYYAEHGAYPESLDAITPDLGAALPRDPFTGEAYHYEPSGDRFVLYSVGPNQVDDGGSRHMEREGDIVWRGRRDPPRNGTRDSHKASPKAA